MTRETTDKASFNYLFLDPDISTNLPMMFRESKQDLWRRFIEAIFYIGRGVRSRPMQHLVEASKTFGIASSIEKLSEKKFKKVGEKKKFCPRKKPKKAPKTVFSGTFHFLVLQKNTASNCAFNGCS